MLLLDGRVRIRSGSLRHARGAIDDGATVWTADVQIDIAGNPYATFQNVLTEIAWRDYFDDPRR